MVSTNKALSYFKQQFGKPTITKEMAEQAIIYLTKEFLASMDTPDTKTAKELGFNSNRQLAKSAINFFHGACLHVADCIRD